ncbi:thiamine-phosphate kinase [Labedaea rhizosphaerae]|uniref:Thiamine-monophosphate kinase n=1 Tax=Labedaea rhizosphaerae TaxID=598644 RepID=A0A4R6SE51_LABRH|nr:thiamine-phosphate kinase [Labedaea rhizosphaerae]TDP98172.1 thiamine-monophosphate kinase [Labedaea rhizosphaerae]
MSKTLGDLGERGIYRTLLTPRYQHVEGFGDDSAVLGRGLVASTDSCPTPLIEKLEPGISAFHEGWLLATINLSDLAAAGAEPLGLVVNYTLPATTTTEYFKQLMDGVDACAAKHRTQVVGGDLRDGKEKYLTATAIGWAEPRLSRRGAEPGDALLLIGDPGYLWAWAATREREDLPKQLRRRLWKRASRPKAQLKAGRLLAWKGLAAAAVDVSDGLYSSVRLLTEANGLGADLAGEIELDAELAKVCELAGLDSFALGQTWGDWSLLVAVHPEHLEDAILALKMAKIGVRRIGTMTDSHTELTVGGVEWTGVDQERFSERSWQGGGIEEKIRALQKNSSGSV